MRINHLFQETNIHRTFVVILIFKGFNAFLEILGGIILFSTGMLSNILIFMTRGELIEDPTDFIANYTQHFIPYLSVHTQLFGAVYLLSHGIINIFLIVAVLRNKLWAYPANLFFLILLILYQIYRLSYSRSPFLLFLTLLDIGLVFLTWHEYRFVQKQTLAKQFDNKYQ